MINAYCRNEKLRDDILSFTSEQGYKVWWLGQSGFLIKHNGETILLDPYLSESLSIKYAQTDKPHTRISELVIRPDLLPPIDVVTSSHNHTDHLDADTLKPILAANPHIHFIIPEANRAFVCERIGCITNLPIGLNEGKSIDIGCFKITGFPAAHNEIEYDIYGNMKCLSYLIQFDRYSIYHSGDTLWYEGLADRLKSANIDLAFLPINGNKVERRVAGNLSYEEAARLGKEAKIGLVIPHHYDLFEFNTEDVALFENKCKEYGTKYKTLMLGEGIFLEK